ncbi:MAG: hypothetical protein ACK47B_09710 [Armatimonadota bacterium]
MKRLLSAAALAAVMLAAPAAAQAPPGESGAGHQHPAPPTGTPNPANPGGSAAPS